MISTLRDGSAAEHAVALMRERGYSNRRKRHRLTPGTVKFAAFHVLSLEGSHGLSILEVADKIQVLFQFPHRQPLVVQLYIYFIYKYITSKKSTPCFGLKLLFLIINF